ncbi:choice-of-anchor J domain-containing protein [Pontibacter sp. H259]|uniref:T9SS-dependent choice-of-anchor J family protein n=1 Tax=Pontibacter sp. H259 TaxID=3133421 RepID=UPI0030C40895
MSKHLQKLCALVLVCCAWFGSSTAWGQVNLQQSPYTENFNTLTSGYPTGWTGVRFGGTGTAGAVLAPVATDGSGSSGAVYSAGLDTDRAMGTLASGSTIPAMGASFTNNTGSTLNQIKISAVMEQWRSGSNASQNEVVKFEYSLNATAINDAAATWVAVTDLDLKEILVSTTAAAPVDGNATANKANITTDLAALGWENGKILWIRWIDTDNTGSDGIYAVDDFKIEFTSNATTPALSAPSSLNLGETLINNVAAGEYSLSASNLTGNVTVTAAAPFTVSKTAATGFASSITFTPAELQSNVKVYVQGIPTALGNVSGSITHTSAGATDVVMNVAVFSHSPYIQNFTNCTGGTTITGGWMQYSVNGDLTWACTTFGQQGSGVQMSGFANSTNNANTDWLISPKMDFSSFAIPLMSINYRTKFAGSDLKVMVSTNYTGAGDPTAATWTELAVLTADNADAWKLLENLSLQNYKSANTYVAFVYTSTTESAARWTLDNFEVKNVNTYLNTTNLNLNFAETAAGSKSAAQEFTFSAGGYTTDVVVSVPANFEISDNGTDYAPSLTYSSTQAAASNKVYVRFAPTTTALLSTGPVTFTSGSEAVITRGMLSGSSLLKANTLEVVTWNMEWFGATGSGPDDEQLQYDNAKKVIQQLDADIIGVQEVVDEAKIQQLAAETGYTYTTETMSWQASNEQKVGFLYKTSVVTMKKEKVLLSKLFSDIKSGAKDLADYPTSDDLFWASGRLPYLVEFQATINGVKQTLHVVNLHAKANGENSTQDYDRRKYDAKVLKDSLDAQYSNVNLILLGDFNDDVDKSVIGTNQPSSFDVFVAATNDYTTLTKALSEADKVTYESGSLRSFLDHIFISNELTDEYVPGSIAIEELLLTTIPNFRTNTSDHLPVSARFTLTADPVTPATVSFTTASVSKAEDAGKFNVSLTLSKALETAQTVTITPTAASTATAADYTITGASNGAITVTIPANATTATFEVGITDDTETEGAEQVVFEISNPSTDLVIGTAKTFTLTIEANDVPTPATVTFTTASVSKAEDAGAVTVSLTLSKAMATAQTITVAPVAGGTASAADYTLTGATNNALTVTIPANATTATFSVNITDDTDTEAAEQVVFELSNPSSGLVLGTAKTFTLTIEANDAPTGIADGTKGQFSVYPTIVNGGNVRLLLPERIAATAKVNMVIYSAEGRKVLTTTGTQAAAQASLNRQVAKLPAGIYMILIETGKEYFQTKMVKN